MNGTELAPRGDTGQASARRRRRLRWLRPVAGIVVPLSAYIALAAALHSDTYALAVTETFGVVWILALGIRQGQLNPIAVATAIVLAIALVVTVISGGSALPLKLRRAMITGPLGLACMVSVIARRPLLPALLDLVAHGGPERVTRPLRALRRAIPEDKAISLTAIVGVTLLADAAAQITVAFAVSTTVFVGVSRLARIAISAIGIAVYVAYWRAGGASSQGPAPEPLEP